MPNSDRAGRPGVGVNRSSFLVGDLLLGKLGETVVVHGKAIQDCRASSWLEVDPTTRTPPESCPGGVSRTLIGDILREKEAE
jgi:hypothetical protein